MHYRMEYNYLRDGPSLLGSIHQDELDVTCHNLVARPHLSLCLILESRVKYYNHH